MPIKLQTPKRKKRTVKKNLTVESPLEAALFAHIRIYGLPTPEREYRFDSQRRWRFDFAWPDIKLAVEVEGGIYSHGRHSRGKGMEADMEKYNAAAIAGWRLLRFSRKMIETGMAVQQIRKVLLEE